MTMPRRLRVGETAVIHRNPWRRPQPPMVMEGEVTEEDAARMMADTEARRAAWRPSQEGADLVELLRSQIGCRIEIQAWDVMMVWLEDEGPYPMRAVLVGVETPTGNDGHPMPVLILTDVDVVPTELGYDGRSRDLVARPSGDEFSFEVARMCSCRPLRRARKR